MVDSLSLYLSMRVTADEAIAVARDQIMTSAIEGLNSSTINKKWQKAVPLNFTGG